MRRLNDADEAAIEPPAGVMIRRADFQNDTGRPAIWFAAARQSPSAPILLRRGHRPPDCAPPRARISLKRQAALAGVAIRGQLPGIDPGTTAVRTFLKPA